MDSEAAGHHERPPERERHAAVTRARSEKVSRAIALVALLVAWTLGTRRYAMDPSFWESEAFIAWSLLQLSPGELFGELLTPHSFPRVYLFAIACMKSLLGYETAVLRALPWLAFVWAMALFVRGLYLRFRSEPLLLSIGLALMLSVAVPYAFAARLKQYTLEIAVALLALGVSDAFLERRLREGRQIAILLLLPLPILVSYTYVIVLAARLGAWWLAGGMRGTWRLDVRATALVGASTLVSSGALWWTDLRHTANADALFRFWSRCIVAPDLSNAPRLVGNLLTGWWSDYTAWGSNDYVLGMPGHVTLLAAIALGVAAVVRRAAGRERPVAVDAAAFGSRALANALVPLGLFVVAWITSYPLCPNRLTVFALYSIVMLALEGAGLASTGLARLRYGQILSPLLLVALLVPMLPFAAINAHYQWTEPSPGNIRPFTSYLDERIKLPILVAACSTAQVKTLPEWQGRDDLLFYNPEIPPKMTGEFPDLDRFVVLSAGTHFLCPWFFKRLDEAGYKRRYILPLSRASGIWLAERHRGELSREKKTRKRLRQRRREGEREGGDPPEEAPTPP